MKCFWSDCQEFGINYVSINDIVSLNATVDARACQMACAFRSECRFWTHFKDTNVCNLKADYTLRAVIEHLTAAHFPDKLVLLSKSFLVAEKRSRLFLEIRGSWNPIGLYLLWLTMREQKRVLRPVGTTVSILAFRPRAPGLIPSIPQNFRRKYLSILLRLINSPVLRKVDSGLKMLVKPI